MTDKGASPSRARARGQIHLHQRQRVEVIGSHRLYINPCDDIALRRNDEETNNGEEAKKAKGKSDAHCLHIFTLRVDL